jgi:hypothetical protein
MQIGAMHIGQGTLNIRREMNGDLIKCGSSQDATILELV